MISGSTASCRIGASRPRFYASAGRPPLVIGRAAGSATDQPPTFRPTPWSPLGPTDTSFIDDDGGVFNYAEPLAASRGLVLVKLVPSTLNLQWTRHDTSTPSPSSLPSSTPSPANATSPRLPALASHAVHTYAIVTTADLDPRSRSCSSSLVVAATGLIAAATPSYSAARLHDDQAPMRPRGRMLAAPLRHERWQALGRLRVPHAHDHLDPAAAAAGRW
ncbi:hypothetical protein HU200_064716 [Digitaria exilis]|uniref:Uncharacterized protein n=1 Tax=Digitaria exilis TaxID=1010633 RepID=A0A835A163_9POAL|nr:hypothetical protein HU200_064716 [Digitaria exilis]